MYSPALKVLYPRACVAVFSSLRFWPNGIPHIPLGLVEDKFGLPAGVLGLMACKSLKLRLVTESILVRLRSMLNRCESMNRVLLAPWEVSDVMNWALKKGQVCVINSFSSKNSVFFGGIPSGHSVLARPLNTSVTTLIFVGFKSLRIKVPRSIAGDLSAYSDGSKPVT